MTVTSSIVEVTWKNTTYRAGTPLRIRPSTAQLDFYIVVPISTTMWVIGPDMSTFLDDLRFVLVTCFFPYVLIYLMLHLCYVP